MRRRISRATCAHCDHVEDAEPRFFAAVLDDGSWLPLPPGAVMTAREVAGESFGALRKAGRILDAVRRRCDRCGKTHDRYSPRPYGVSFVTCLPLLLLPPLAIAAGVPTIPALGIALAAAWAGYFAWRGRSRRRLAARWPDLPTPTACPHCQAGEAHLHPVGTVSQRRVFPCPECGDPALTHRIVELPD